MVKRVGVKVEVWSTFFKALNLYDIKLLIVSLYTY